MRVLERLGEAWRFVTSRTGSHWLLGALALLLLVWLVPFQLTGQPSETVEAIGWTWWPFVTLYAAIGLATIVCTFRRVRTDIRKTRATLEPRETPSAHAVRLEGGSYAEALAALRSAGFEVRDHGQRAGAVRRWWAPLGGTAFHLGILVFACGLILHANASSTVSFTAIEGQSLAAGLDPSASAEAAAAARLVETYVLSSVDPEYYRDYLLFSRLDATIERADGTERGLALADPLWLDPLTLLCIEDYGLAPQLEVSNSQSSIEESATVAMKLLPPGKEDSVTLPSSDVVLDVRVYPDYGVRNGKAVSLSYNLRDPKMLVSVASVGDAPSVLGRGLIGVGQYMDAGPNRVGLLGMSRYGTFRVMRSPGIPVVAAGLLLMCLGLLVRFGGRRLDVIVWDENGVVVADAYADLSGRAGGRAELPLLMHGNGGARR